MEKQEKDENNNQSDQIYVHLHPFRAVLPYDHKYETFAKSRWYGKPLLQTLVKQFKAYDFQYYKSAIQEGKITINGKKVSSEYVIKNGDKLIHSAVRQQPPILDLDIQIIHEDQDYLVVNKPPSFTVHTGGGFHYNTLSSILQIQKGYKNLFVLHRLDRLTSGLIIYGKSKQKPQIFHKQNQSEQMKKMYFARVSGNFAWDQKILSAEIQCVSHKDGIYKVTRELQLKDQKASIQENQENQNEGGKMNGQKKREKNNGKEGKKKAIQGDNPDIKDSKTRFKKVFYDKETDSSLIECYPISGRTHQIRVHLQFLGFPILNDVVYGGRFVGNNIIKTIVAKKSSDKQKKNQHYGEEKDLEHNYGSKKPKLEDQGSQKQSSKAEKGTEKLYDTNGQKLEVGSNIIQNQKIKKLRQKLAKQWDIESKPWEICLHSYQYKLQGKVYRTQKPYWADQKYKFDL